MTTPDWLPGIRQCCAYWRDAPMLQHTLEALEREFAIESDACIDCAKGIVECICGLIIDELDDPTSPLKPPEANPTFGSLVSAAVRVLKLGDVRDDAFRKVVSQHHKLTTALGDLRNEAGPTSHGKDAFISKLSAHHRRAALLSADAIVTFLHEAYLDAELSLNTTREPYEKFVNQNALIDEYALVSADTDEDGHVKIFISLPDGSEIPLAAEASRLLFYLDRTAYIQALESAKNQKMLDSAHLSESETNANNEVIQ